MPLWDLLPLGVAEGPDLIDLDVPTRQVRHRRVVVPGARAANIAQELGNGVLGQPRHSDRGPGAGTPNQGPENLNPLVDKQDIPTASILCVSGQVSKGILRKELVGARESRYAPLLGSHAASNLGEPAMASSVRFDHIQTEIAGDVLRSEFDLHKRQEAIKQLERLAGPPKTRAALFYTRLDRFLSRHDILPLLTMLKSIGTVWNLDLIVVGPGGDGTAAETVLDLCRRYCTRRLRVVIPLHAKSAATLMALGGDEIVMGESSELGPIDAQVYIIQDNHEQQVSADHFLRAEKDATKELAASEPQRQHAARIKLAQLSPAFLAHCRDLMNFSKEFAGSQLKHHMFKAEMRKSRHLWDSRIARIVDKLTSSSKHLVHGRMITAHAIRDDPDLKHLKIRVLDPGDEYWLSLQELLVRTEIIVQRKGDIGKVIFTSDMQMLGG